MACVRITCHFKACKKLVTKDLIFVPVDITKFYCYEQSWSLGNTNIQYKYSLRKYKYSVNIFIWMLAFLQP